MTISERMKQIKVLCDSANKGFREVVKDLSNGDK